MQPNSCMICVMPLELTSVPSVKVGMLIRRLPWAWSPTPIPPA